MARAIWERVQTAILVIAILIIAAALMMFFLKIKPAVVLSGSMEPEIKTGSLIFIDRKDKDISEGDIIAFYSGETFVAHRAVRREGNRWVTKGDNNECEDHHTVRADDVEGKVKFWIPGAGVAVRSINEAVRIFVG